MKSQKDLTFVSRKCHEWTFLVLKCHKQKWDHDILILDRVKMGHDSNAFAYDIFRNEAIKNFIT